MTGKEMAAHLRSAATELQDLAQEFGRGFQEVNLSTEHLDALQRVQDTVAVVRKIKGKRQDAPESTQTAEADPGPTHKNHGHAAHQHRKHAGR